MRRKKEHAEAVNRLAIYSLHLALETCGRVTLRRLPPTDSQHIRCRSVQHIFLFYLGVVTVHSCCFVFIILNLIKACVPEQRAARVLCAQ